MLVHHFLICKLPNIPICARIKSILWSMFVFCPDESRRKAFDVVIIKDLSRLLRGEENFACKSDSVFTLKAILHVGVTLTLTGHQCSQLRALVLFLF